MTPGNVNPTDSETVGHLHLPVKQHQFRDFISGLLGHAQTTDSTINGPFRLDHRDVLNLHHTIAQRVTEQNGAVLASFSATIFYDDNSSVSLSKSEFENYNEVRSLCSVALVVKWIYLIQFTDRQYPEKQEIVIAFHGASTDLYDDLSPLIYRLELRSPGSIRTTITHTARSWGLDMNAIIKAHLERLLLRHSDLRKCLSHHSDSFGLVVAVGFIISSIVSGLIVTQRAATERTINVQGQLAAASDVSERIDLLASEIASGFWAGYYFQLAVFMVIMVFIGIFAGIATASVAKDRLRSRIVLTDASAKAETADAAPNYWGRVVGSFCASVITGIVSNIIFVWIRP